MRLKLVVGASLLAAIAGAGSCIAIVQFVFASLKPISSPGLLVSATFLIPTAAITFASIFTYRHTARRRKVQAVLTALLAIILTLLLFIGAYILNARRMPTVPTETPRPRVT
ncbi:MAG: hypothetical protein C5B55_07205 [Blastocatellia bacterium]|nr:MAG: hypothetical protein C5B55_07205 [Blastocatellia bacterium]